MGSDMIVVSGAKNKSMSFDVKEVDLKGLEVGEKVSITLTGTIKSLSAPYEYDTVDKKGKDITKKDPFARMELKVKEYNIKAEGNEFTKLADQEMK